MSICSVTFSFLTTATVAYFINNQNCTYNNCIIGMWFFILGITLCSGFSPAFDFNAFEGNETGIPLK
jgi:hypothetical protein